MGKNILIFSDGTGQAGGLRPDQRLSNIYKLYRATRVGPDNVIDPDLQVAFYDTGLGSGENSGPFWASPITAARKTFASATGGGISRNMVDCYEAILKHYHAGDRVYLFGFSRGGYTIRCVANVLSLCGIPTRGKGGALPRSGKALRAIAEEAVYKVYDHCAGRKNSAYREEQAELARRFRDTYDCHKAGDATKANVAPYFIGAFDAVAALGMSWVTRTLALSVCALVGFAASFLAGQLLGRLLGVQPMDATYFLFGALGLWAAVTFVRNQFKYIGHYPTRWRFRWHFAIWRFKNGESDEHLDTEVGYARHAIAIDETRESFGRVRWGHKAEWPNRPETDATWFVQKWFAGNHSDIGGSYPEDESRLSDIALDWMIKQTNKVPHPIIIDDRQLNLFPRADGVQHSEIERLREALYPSWWPKRFRWSWPEHARFAASGSPRHPTVDQRFAFDGVQQCAEYKIYRPLALIYDPKVGAVCQAANGHCLPENFEEIWAKVKCSESR